MTQVIGLLRAHDAVVEICAIDSGHHGPSGVARFKAAQARKIREAVTPNHHPNLARQVHKIAEDWESLPDQLALQFVAAVVVVDTVIRNATNYYAQRLPMELGAFNWCIDAKDRAPTDYEETWRLLLVPFLQTISVSNPFPSIRIRGFDYSHFERFDSTLAEMPDYLKAAAPGDNDEPFMAIDVGTLMGESFRLADSAREPGLQMADCVASAFSRAMNQSLDISGWADLGTLVIYRRDPCVRFITVDEDPAAAGDPIKRHHARVLEQIKARAKPMLVPGT